MWRKTPNKTQYESTYNTHSYHSPRQCTQGCTADTVDHWTMAHTSGSRIWRHNRYNVSHTPNSLYQTDSLHILDHAKRRHLYISMTVSNICLHHGKIFWSYVYIHNYIHICLFSSNVCILHKVELRLTYHLSFWILFLTILSLLVYMQESMLTINFHFTDFKKDVSIVIRVRSIGVDLYIAGLVRTIYYSWHDNWCVVVSLISVAGTPIIHLRGIANLEEVKSKSIRYLATPWKSNVKQ